MEFCSKCGTRLVKENNKDEMVPLLICPKCGQKKPLGNSKKKPLENIVNTPRLSKSISEEQIIVIGKKEQKLQTLPTVTIECPKCSNNSAYVWQVQTRGADESSTLFFRCTKCNYTFREYH
jgi:DNA-directed RNA polymerase subunit M